MFRCPTASIACLTMLGLPIWSGCQGQATQSALHPAGPAATWIAWLSWLMIGAFGVVFVFVVGLLLVAIFLPKAAGRDPPLGGNGFIIAGGIALPVLFMIPLLFFSLETSAALEMPADALLVEVTGNRWWWKVRYPDQDIVTANEIHIPAGKPVRLALRSSDVIHSFWVPRLNGKRDLIPGSPTTFWIQADRPGVYRGQCAEYCGTQHAHMAFVVVALPAEEFQDWLAARQTTHSEPATEELQRGRQVFLRAGCKKCHTIRGADAQGQIGPDLTHVGSRLTLGAGMLPNSYGNLMGWIGDAPSIKPGVRMPSTYLPPDDLRALARYLQSLH